MVALSLPDFADLGTGLAPLAVIVGAMAAAWYARANHKEQLRQALALQDERLNHDRHVQDRAALRAMLDELVVDVTAAFDAVNRAQNRFAYLEIYEAVLRFLHNPPDPEPELADQERSEAHEALDAEKDALNALDVARKAVSKIAPNQYRLRMRLRDADAIVRTHWAVRQMLVGWQLSINSDPEALPVSRDSITRAKTHLEPAQERLDDFLDACRDWFDTRPIQEPTGARSGAQESPSA
jgi:hypothetical protein